MKRLCLAACLLLLSAAGFAQTPRYIPGDVSYPNTETLIVGRLRPPFTHTTGTTGWYNTLIGASNSGTALTIGHSNTSVGVWTFYAATEADMSVAIGGGALQNVTTGDQNQGFGYAACGGVTTGNDNVCVGRSTSNGFPVTGTGTWNVAVGNNALNNHQSGSYNVVVGARAGYQSGASPATANALTTGASNTFIGYQSGYGSATQRTNATAIGFEAYVDASNTVALGDENVTEVRAGSAAQAKVATVGLTMTSTAFASLGTPANGTVVYCNDCANASNPCTGSSTGAIAKRLNGAWDCR